MPLKTRLQSARAAMQAANNSPAAAFALANELEAEVERLEHIETAIGLIHPVTEFAEACAKVDEAFGDDPPESYENEMYHWFSIDDIEALANSCTTYGQFSVLMRKTLTKLVFDAAAKRSRVA